MPNPSPAPSSRPDSREHADTVRRYLGKQYPETRPAVAALDALLAHVERLEGVKVAALTYIYARGDDTEAYQALCDAVDHSPPPTAAEIREDGSPVAAYTHFRRRALNAESERDEAYRQAAQADEANMVMGKLARRRLEALRQARDCCARPPGVCFDPDLADGGQENPA